MLLDQITSRLRKREDNGELRVIEDYQAKEVNRRIVVDFSSNDYLSFSTNSEVGEDYLRKLAKLGRPALGASGSRTASGNSPRHVELENRLASLHGTEAALLFNSGYDANVAVWAYVPQPGDIVLFDELIHASIHEGLRLSRAGTKIQFAHNSVQELCTQLRKVCELSAVSKGATNVFLALETLYSMDGDLAPLESISSVVKELFPKGNCYVIVDEVCYRLKSYLLSKEVANVFRLILQVYMGIMGLDMSMNLPFNRKCFCAFIHSEKLLVAMEVGRS